MTPPNFKGQLVEQDVFYLVITGFFFPSGDALWEKCVYQQQCAASAHMDYFIIKILWFIFTPSSTVPISGSVGINGLEIQSA